MQHFELGQPFQVLQARVRDLGAEIQFQRLELRQAFQVLQAGVRHLGVQPQVQRLELRQAFQVRQPGVRHPRSPKLHPDDRPAGLSPSKKNSPSCISISAIALLSAIRPHPASPGAGRSPERPSGLIGLP